MEVSYASYISCIFHFHSATSQVKRNTVYTHLFILRTTRKHIKFHAAGKESATSRCACIPLHTNTQAPYTIIRYAIPFIPVSSFAHTHRNEDTEDTNIAERILHYMVFRGLVIKRLKYLSGTVSSSSNARQ